jgi:hypothetical protein
MRHNLSDMSVRAATVLGSWASHPGVIPHDEVAAIFMSKANRPKGKPDDEPEPDIILVE